MTRLSETRRGRVNNQKDVRAHSSGRGGGGGGGGSLFLGNERDDRWRARPVRAAGFSVDARLEPFKGEKNKNKTLF